MGCRELMKVHILHAHLDNFKKNFGVYSEEQGKRFHRDIEDFEVSHQKYQRKTLEKRIGN